MFTAAGPVRAKNVEPREAYGTSTVQATMSSRTTTIETLATVVLLPHHVFPHQGP